MGKNVYYINLVYYTNVLSILDCYIPIRYIYMILGFCGMLITYGLKTNLAMAMVSMVNHTAIRLEQEQHQNSSRGLYFNTRHGEEINVESSVEEVSP